MCRLRSHVWIVRLLRVIGLGVSLAILLAERLGKRLCICLTVSLLAHIRTRISRLGATAFAAEIISGESPAVRAGPRADDLALASTLATEVQVIYGTACACPGADNVGNVNGLFLFVGNFDDAEVVS